MEYTIETPKELFTEKHAGIEEFLALEGVSIPCSIKHRYSDFIVNEIGLNGDVIWFRPEDDIAKWS
jgi:hypothetical protein